MMGNADQNLDEMVAFPRGAEPNLAAGIIWYTRDSFAKCLKLYGDAADYHRTFDAWLIAAEETEQLMQHKGVRSVRVFVDPQTFPKWCKANGYRRLDATARTAYASVMAEKSLRGTPNEQPTGRSL